MTQSHKMGDPLTFLKGRLVSLSDVILPEDFLCKWQETADAMAKIFDVPAGLITRVWPEELEILVASRSAGNPYPPQARTRLDTGQYCESVMAARTMLAVPNAADDPAWRDNPNMAMNMVSYLGVPLQWDDEEIFGTICVLDNKARHHQAHYVDLLWVMKRSIEADFKLIQHQHRLQVSNAELEQANRELNQALASLTTMQSELLRSEKMAALGALVVGIAHELNTPLGNSLMAASTLQERSHEFATQVGQGLTRAGMNQFVDAVQQGSAILMRSLEQAAQLVGRFKQIAIDQSGMARGSFLLGPLLDDVVASLRGSAQPHIVRQVEAGLALDSYPAALAQVLTSLVCNALLHGFRDRPLGTVTVTAEAAPDDQVRIAVCDDGVGIPAAHLNRVFDPFFTTRLGHGDSGLGLHIAYNLVHTVLGGTIAASSPEGQGACFTLLLPRRAPQGTTASAPQTAT
jgi:signal transduction histidine kinase